ncbi:uncharacterized protein DS421_4g117390 [Arachis hypogaea]|nr:uncharacterized protein DS421_4g117390 [Arachis hypogaea]
MIFDHYLAVQRWRPNFNPNVEHLNKIVAWVRISDLPIEYYDKYVLRTIGNTIRMTLKVDYNTAEQTRGKFARVCVELDLTKPLRPNIKIKGKIAFVEYEGLHTICFQCGINGQSKEQFPHMMENKAGTKDNLEKEV